MAGVTVRRDDYEDGALPQVCVYSGDRAEILVDHHSRAGASPLVLLLLVFGPIGIVVAVIIDHLMKVEATGLIPMSRAVHTARRARRRRWDRLALTGVVTAAVGFAGLFVAPDVTGLWVGAMAAGLLVGLAAWFASSIGLIQGRPDRTGRSVALGNVHPAFAAAYRAQDDRRAETRRRALGGGTGPAGPVDADPTWSVSPS